MSSVRLLYHRFLGQADLPSKPDLNRCLQALAVIRSMSCRWSDQDISASLNRMDMRTGQDLTWNANRVSSVRREHGIHAYRSAENNGKWLTLSEAAKLVGVTNHVIRRLI